MCVVEKTITHTRPSLCSASSKIAGRWKGSEPASHRTYLDMTPTTHVTYIHIHTHTHRGETDNRPTSIHADMHVCAVSIPLSPSLPCFRLGALLQPSSDGKITSHPHPPPPPPTPQSGRTPASLPLPVSLPPPPRRHLYTYGWIAGWMDGWTTTLWVWRGVT